MCRNDDCPSVKIHQNENTSGKTKERGYLLFPGPGGPLGGHHLLHYSLRHLPLASTGGLLAANTKVRTIG